MPIEQELTFWILANCPLHHLKKYNVIYSIRIFLIISNLAKVAENQLSKNDMNGYSNSVSSGLYSLNFIIVYTRIELITCFQLYLGFFSFFSQIWLKSQSQFCLLATLILIKKIWQNLRVLKLLDLIDDRSIFWKFLILSLEPKGAQS